MLVVIVDDIDKKNGSSIAASLFCRDLWRIPKCTAVHVESIICIISDKGCGRYSTRLSLTTMTRGGDGWMCDFDLYGNRN